MANWCYGKGRFIFLSDHEENILHPDENEMWAREVWDNCYSHISEFVNVPFLKFKKHLQEHRKQVGERLANSLRKKWHFFMTDSSTQDKLTIVVANQCLIFPCNKTLSRRCENKVHTHDVIF